MFFSLLLFDLFDKRCLMSAHSLSTDEKKTRLDSFHCSSVVFFLKMPSWLPNTSFSLLSLARLPRNVNPLENPNKRDLVRLSWVGGLSIFFLTLLFVITTFTHFTSFKYDVTDETKLDQLVNDTVRLVTRCEKIANYRLGNLIFFPIAVALILMFSWSVKREKRCLHACDGRPGKNRVQVESTRLIDRWTFRHDPTDRTVSYG